MNPTSSLSVFDAAARSTDIQIVVDSLEVAAFNHRTVIGQDVSYRRDPNEQTYTYVLYVQRNGLEVSITSNDGWYGVKTLLCDDESAATQLLQQILADPKAMLQEIYENDCAWFEPLVPQISGVTAGDAAALEAGNDIHVRLLPPRHSRLSGPSERAALSQSL